MLKRRFIAGAVCPACEQMDKVVMYDDEQGVRWRECVSCGFRDKLVEQPPQETVEELKTRVNQPLPGEKPLAHETPVEVVSIIDPRKLH